MKEQIITMALKMILRIIATAADCVLIFLAGFLFLGSIILASSLERIALVFLIALLLIGPAVINLLAIWVTALSLYLTTRGDLK